MFAKACWIMLALVPGIALARVPDWSLYAGVLRDYVVPGEKDGIRVNLVDYAGLADDPAFSELVGDIRAFDPGQLSGDKERLAFYINAYNILALQLVLDHWPVKSMKDIGNVLQDAWHVILLDNRDGRMSLDDIDRNMLMPIGDRRVHFAIDCDAVSGPNLRREPYRAATLDAQLDAQVREFLAQKDKGLVVRNGKGHISHLFARYRDYFDGVGGIAHFIRRYRPDLAPAGLEADIPWDWALNSQEPASSN